MNMNNALVNLLAMMIRGKEKRQYFRKKYRVPTMRDLEQLRSDIWHQSDMQHDNNILPIFFDILQNLPKLPEKQKSVKSKDAIPIFLVSDDAYVPFIFTTMLSILHNTNSYIKFYILEEGVNNENKNQIKSLADKYDNFTIKFIHVDSKEIFSQITFFSETNHVSLATCNRMLIPLLVPEINRAIYLDVDIIAMGDIADLWNEDLDGKILGAVKLFDLHSRYNQMLSFLKQDNLRHEYFNSGVMLIDYEKWRSVENESNERIIEKLQNIIKKIEPNICPDELVLNHYFSECGYKKLPFKYNIQAIGAYRWLKKNKKTLSQMDLYGLNDMQVHLDHEKDVTYFLNNDDIVMRHFFAHEKPWNTLRCRWFPEKIMSNFSDFWAYAIMTPFFNEMKMHFIEANMR